MIRSKRVLRWWDEAFTAGRDGRMEPYGDVEDYFSHATWIAARCVREVAYRDGCAARAAALTLEELEAQAKLHGKKLVDEQV